MNHPSLGLLRDYGFLGPVVCILEGCVGAHGQRLADPFIDTLTGHAHRSCNLADVFAGMVPQHDTRSLRLSPRCGARIPQTAEVLDLLRAEFQACPF